MVDVAVSTDNLCKSFDGGTVAVSGLDLNVPTGCVYGLVGRNGAGKTTALRMLMGLLEPSAGSTRVLGRDLRLAPAAHRSQVAYVSQTQQLHIALTLSEHCDYISHFYPAWNGDRATRLAQRFELPEHQQIGLMSGGQQRKAAIVLALACTPRVLVLDEPAAGLDPVARRQLIDEIIDLISDADGCTVLFSTHILSDLERIAEYVGVMDRGRLVMSDPLEQIQSGTRRIQVVFESDSPPAGFEIPGVLRTKTEGPVVTGVVRLVSETQLDGVRRIPGVRVNEFPMSLEETMIDLLGPES